MRKSRPNAYEVTMCSFIFVLHFAVVFMRWWWPPLRVNGLRRCELVSRFPCIVALASNIEILMLSMS